MKKNDIKNLVANNEISEAINEAIELAKANAFPLRGRLFKTLQERWKCITEGEMDGVFTSSFISEERGNIRELVLLYLDQLGEDVSNTSISLMFEEIQLLEKRISFLQRKLPFLENAVLLESNSSKVLDLQTSIQSTKNELESDQKKLVSLSNVKKMELAKISLRQLIYKKSKLEESALIETDPSTHFHLQTSIEQIEKEISDIKNNLSVIMKDQIQSIADSLGDLREKLIVEIDPSRAFDLEMEIESSENKLNMLKEEFSQLDM